ncbi:MAG TPA: alpha/beta fold hydrolase [Candidatus Dormibacteraeota bacterium]|nr:alpha/beta fold hydrolase [Candidatus Dormibacteraeota bacterium]
MEVRAASGGRAAVAWTAAERWHGLGQEPWPVDDELLGEQVIGFLTHRGGQVAYAVTGTGPPLLLDVGRVHHLEAFWEHVPYRHLVQRLSRRFTVVRWDRPGLGMSDRGVADLSPEAEEALVERLVDHLGGTPIAVVAAGGAGPTMVRYAARHPEHIARLALFGTVADRGALLPGLTEAARELLAGASAPAVHDVVAAALAAGSEPDVSSWLASALETSADVPTMMELVARPPDPHAESHAAFVRAPTLVLHRAQDPVVDAALGRALASRIPGARFVMLGGSSHLIYAGDPEPLIGALLPFLVADGGGEPVPLSQRELEIARMVTFGLTNAEIGHRLSIRRRTVDAHLEHIRAKLRVNSRARIAAWAARNQPPDSAQDGL